MVSMQITSENCADKDFRILPALQYQNGKPTLQNKDSPRKSMPSPQTKKKQEDSLLGLRNCHSD